MKRGLPSLIDPLKRSWQKLQKSVIFQHPILQKIIAIFRRINVQLRKNDIPFRSAALAYYGLFSLFPLLLFLVFLGSQFLESEEARIELNQRLSEFLPVASETVQSVIDQTIRARGPMGLIGGFGLLWAASSMFNQLTTSLNIIWGARPRSFWRHRLVALASVLTIAIFFILSITLSALAAFPRTSQQTGVLRLFGIGLGLGITILLFWLLYYRVPNTKISAKASFGGAILAAILWQIAKSAFAWYLASGLNNYGTVYGSLASVIALVLWAYISSLTLFLGAEFGAALQHEVWPVRKKNIQAKSDTPPIN